MLATTLEEDEANLDPNEIIDDLLAQAESFRKKGRNGQEIVCLEQALKLQRAHWGVDSHRSTEAESFLATRYNDFALRLVMKHAAANYEIALELFRKALALTQGRQVDDLIALRAATLSNISCLHRRFGDLHQALRAITAAVKTEKSLPSKEGTRSVPVPDTLLNMSTILSELGRHRSAIHYAQSALNVLHARLARPALGIDQHPLHLTTAVAYHNIAVENEHLRRFDVARTFYAKALDFSKLYLPPGHNITTAIAANFKSLERQMKITQGPAVVRRRALSLAKNRMPTNDTLLFNIAVSTATPQLRYKIKPKSATPRKPRRAVRPSTSTPKKTSSPTRRRIKSAMDQSKFAENSTLNTRLSNRTSMDVIRSLFAAPEQLTGAPSRLHHTKGPDSAVSNHRMLVDISLDDDGGYWSDGPTISKQTHSTPKFTLRSLPWTPKPQSRGLIALAVNDEKSLRRTPRLMSKTPNPK